MDQIIGEIPTFNSSAQDSSFDAIGVIPDYKRKHHATHRMKSKNKLKTQTKKFALALLQEEHALWLK